MRRSPLLHVVATLSLAGCAALIGLDDHGPPRSGAGDDGGDSPADDSDDSDDSSGDNSDGVPSTKTDGGARLAPDGVICSPSACEAGVGCCRTGFSFTCTSLAACGAQAFLACDDGRDCPSGTVCCLDFVDKAFSAVRGSSCMITCTTGTACSVGVPPNDGCSADAHCDTVSTVVGPVNGVAPFNLRICK